MSAVGVDPRIRARRAEVARDLGRRRLRRLAAVGAAGAVAAAGWGVTRTPVLDVDHVAVSGAVHTGAAAVRDASLLSRDDRLVTVPLGRIARRVAALPWVATAEVSRDWPGTVRIRVVERVAVAAVPAEGQGWVLLDAARRQLAHVPGPPPEVVQLDVPAVPASPGATATGDLGHVLAVAATVPAPLRERLVALRPSGERGIDASVRVGSRLLPVRLGDVAQPSATWRSLAAVLDDADLRTATTIDLRVPSAPVLLRG